VLIPIERGHEEIGNVTRKLQFLAGIITLITLALPGARAQDESKKNKVGLVIGGTVTPGRSFSPAGAGTASFDPSLALGAEYDHRVLDSDRIAVYGAIDFLASPLDVKLSNPPLT
jgi:hypothetical protein